MSNSDSFFDEVSQEVKRDRLFALMRRYSWIVILAVVAVVIFAAWNEWSKARASASAQAFGDAIVSALEAEEPAARRAGLAALAQDAGTDAARAGLANLLLAAEALESDERPAALAALATVAEDTRLPLSYRQLATLKRVIASTPEDLSLAEREALIVPLAVPGGAFRPLALEQMALLRLEAGDRTAALSGLDALLREPDLSPGLRGRVQQMIVILGGTFESDLG